MTDRVPAEREQAPAPQTELQQKLLSYFAARQQQHQDTVERALDQMTERERRLVREAAVMGYVRGRMSMPGNASDAVPIPPDTHVVVEVLGAALAMPDLYPITASLLSNPEASEP